MAGITKTGKGYSGIRVFRNASHTLTTSLAQLPFDTVSSLLTAENLSLSGGDIIAGVGGKLRLDVFVQAAAAALATGIAFEIRKNPAGTNTLIAADTCPGPTNTNQTHNITTVFDVVAGDVIRAMVASLGDSADIVVGDGVTRAYALITP
jgi:hypothetical protein